MKQNPTKNTKADRLAVEQLGELRDAVDESRYEFKTVLEGIDDERLEPVFENAVERRERYAEELTQALDNFQISAPERDPSPSFRTWLRSLWTELKATLVSNPARVLFRDFEQHDQNLLGAYHRAMGHIEVLPRSVASIVERQHDRIASELVELVEKEDELVPA